MKELAEFEANSYQMDLFSFIEGAAGTALLQAASGQGVTWQLDWWALF
jgi:hypothetical protein